MADRSVRVQLSANASGFVSGMRTAENAIQAFARQGVQAKAPFEQLRKTLDLASTAAGRLANHGKDIGRAFAGSVGDVTRLGAALAGLSSPGLTGTMRDVDRLATAIHSLGTGSSVADVGHLATNLHGLGTVDLSGVASDVRKIAQALAGIPTGGIADITHLTTGLHGLGAVNLNGVASDIRKIMQAITSLPAGAAADLGHIATALHGFGSVGAALVGTPNQLSQLGTAIRAIVRIPVSDIHATANALRALGTAGGSLGGLGTIGPALAHMQAQINALRAALAALNGGGGGGGGGGGAGGSGSSGGIFSRIFGTMTIGRLVGFATSILSVGAAIRSTVKITADYQTSLATLGVVGGASGAELAAQMTAAGTKARELGADATIAGASAADAAVVMTELAKGGFSVADSMEAAKATLQLAAAASVDGATAAGIQASALNAFSLNASHAGEVADLLANTANAATGDIGDFALGLQQAGQPAANLGVSLQDTLVTLAEFAKAGIKGSDAGTSLKSTLLALETPTGKQAAAMEELGLTVYNAQGKFVGMRVVSDELSKARQKMTDEEYNTATAVVFGSDAVRAAGILAKNGAAGFDAMTKSVMEGGGVAKASEAKMSGLAGAMGNLRNQVENAQIMIGEKFSPAIEGALGVVAGFVPKLQDAILGGPTGGLAVIGDKLGAIFKPLITGAGELISTAWPYVQSFAGFLGDAFNSILDFVSPVAQGIGDFVKGFIDNGIIQGFGDAIVGLGSAFAGLMDWLAPVGKVIGDVVGFIGDLPAPIWLGVAAMGAFLLLRAPLSGALLQLTYGYVRLASAISAATGASILAGIRSIGASMLTAFGGPVGVAIGVVTVALGFFLSSSSDAVASTLDFSSALDENTGRLKENAGATLSKQVADAGTGDALAKIGLSVNDYTEALTGGASKQDAFAKRLQNSVVGQGDWDAALKRTGYTVDELSLQVVKGNYVLLGNQDAIHGAQDAYAAFGTDSSKLNDEQRHLTQSLAQTALHADDVREANRGLSRSSIEAASAVKTQAEQTAEALQTLTQAGQAVAHYEGHLHFSVDDKGVGTFFTDTETAFEKYKADVQSAQDVSELFFFKLQELSGRDLSLEQKLRQDAAAVRELGAAFRDQAAVAADVVAKTAALKTAQANVGKKDKDGKAATDATTTADVAAAARDLYTAQLAVASSADAVADAQTKAAGAMIDVVTQDALAVDKKKGYTAAVEAGIVSLGKQRKAFVDSYVAGKQASMTDAEKKTSLTGLTVEAGKAADALKLIPDKKTVTAILDADSTLLEQKARIAKKAAEDATKARTLKLSTDTADALGKLRGYNGDVSKMPKAVKTRFDADVATAKASGLSLFRVYNANTGTWTSQFMTQGTAAAQEKAGATLQAYNATTGRFMGDLQVTTEPATTNAYALKQAAIDAAASREGTITIYTGAAMQALADLNIAANNAAAASARAAASPTRPIGGNAAGGTITGGTPGRDSVLSWLMPGEEVIRTKQAEKHRPLLKAINAGAAGYALGGTIPGALAGLHKYATGGTVPPSVRNLSGIEDAAYGQHLTTVLAALQQFADSVADAATAVADAKTKLADTTSTRADKQGSYNDAAANHAQADRDRRAADKAAKAAATAKQKADAAKGFADAAQDRITSKTSAADKRKINAAATEANAAARAAASAKKRADADVVKAKADQAAATKKQATAKQELNASVTAQTAARNAVASTTRHSAALVANQRAQQANYRSLQTLAARYDTLTPKIDAAQSDLATRRSDRAALASSVAGTVSGFDGGLTGHSDTRTTYETILAGQQYNLAKEQKFAADLAALKAKGLSASAISEIAGQGVDGGGTAAAALATASKEQLAVLNANAKAQADAGKRAGETVASGMYDAGINAAAGLVKGLLDQQKAVQAAMVKLAGTASTAFKNALKIRSPSQVFHGYGANIGKGVELGVTSRYSAINAAVAGMVTVPRLPQPVSVSTGGGLGNIAVYLGDRELTDLVRVEINGHAVDLTNKFRNRKGQA